MSEAIGGRYVLLRRIAVGGMAEVFLARQAGLPHVEKIVVIKRILPHLAADPGFVEMFLDEARTVADLRHPNVVSVFEAGEESGAYFIAMEYLQGRARSSGFRSRTCSASARMPRAGFITRT